jgi:hypothetical protein
MDISRIRAIASFLRALLIQPLYLPYDIYTANSKPLEILAAKQTTLHFDNLETSLNLAMISDEVHSACIGKDTVSTCLAVDTSLSPADLWSKLFGRNAAKKSEKGSGSVGTNEEATSSLSRAEKCGRWGTAKPSELFLTVYNDVLRTLDDNLSAGMVSPPLMGSCGTVPLTIMST